MKAIKYINDKLLNLENIRLSVTEHGIKLICLEVKKKCQQIVMLPTFKYPSSLPLVLAIYTEFVLCTVYGKVLGEGGMRDIVEGMVMEGSGGWERWGSKTKRNCLGERRWAGSKDNVNDNSHEERDDRCRLAWDMC